MTRFSAIGLSNAGQVREWQMSFADPVTNPDFLSRSYHATSHIIAALETGNFPNQGMLTLHPQRWTDNKFLWTKEFIAQNLKNQIKRVLVSNLTLNHLTLNT